VSASLSLAATLLAAAAAAAPAAQAKAPAAVRGRVTGVGGLFFKSRDPKALAAWYKDVLGLPIEDWGGAALPYDQPGHPPVLVVSPFPADSSYFAPSEREFMLNFAVDDLDAFLARLAAKGVAVQRREDNGPNGRFAWILDPDGVKIELWEPKRTP
jgi:catechol 2,3-dioxygenase-like lactoylglutathione lyase family enzyme